MFINVVPMKKLARRRRIGSEFEPAKFGEGFAFMSSCIH